VFQSKETSPAYHNAKVGCNKLHVLRRGRAQFVR